MSSRGFALALFLLALLVAMLYLNRHGVGGIGWSLMMMMIDLLFLLIVTVVAIRDWMNERKDN